MRIRNIVSFLFFLMLLAKADVAYPQDFIGNKKWIAHPRLLLLDQEERTLSDQLQTNVLLKKVHNAILIQCDSFLNQQPVVPVKIGRRLLDKSRECLKRVFYLSYAWRLTAEKKYFRRAEEELLAVSSYTDWNPSHFLDVAEMTLAVSIGYDWLHKELSGNSRKIIKDAILKKGLKPSLLKQNNGFLTSTNNWNQVCNAGMLYGAIAIYEDELLLAKEIINRSIISVKLSMKEYGPDGAYPEGFSYWGYGTSFNILLISALEKLFGSDFNLSTAPGFLNTAHYYLHMTGPTGACFNYSDSGIGAGIQPTMFWFAAKAQNNSLLYVELNKIQKAPDKNLSADRILPALLIWNRANNLKNIPLPEQTLWIGKGKTPVALMRTSWLSPDAIFVGIKGGSASTSHAHMDAGSFVMESDGVRWVMDAGMQNYESLESKGLRIFGERSQRWEVFRMTNFIHSTLTINGKLQDVKGYAPIIASSNSKEARSATVDLKNIYPDLKKAIRKIAIVENKYLIVKDFLKSGKNATRVRWQILTSANVTLTKEGALLEKNGKTLLLKSNAKVQWKTWSTQPPQYYDAKNDGTILVGFETLLPANNETNITVSLILQNETSKKN